MPFKSYSVSFYTSSIGNEGRPVGPALRTAFENNGRRHLPTFEIGGDSYQVRDLLLTGTVWQGVFAKLRDDAPHVIDAADTEKELDLDDGDRLIEKTHFLFRSRENVLVWQAIRGLGGITTLQLYLTEVLRDMVTFPQIMNDGDLERVLGGQVYELSFAYARPDDVPQNAPLWSKNTFEMMERIDAAVAKFLMRAPRGGSLGDTVKTWVRQLVRGHGVEKIRVRLTEETDPVELFMSPLKAKFRILLNGRYPNPRDVFEALEAAYAEQRRHIRIAVRQEG